MAKKTYQPKPEKIKKLEKVYAELKSTKPTKSLIFGKVVKTLILAILLTSCSAQWHLKQAIKKDPSIIQEREITILDTIVVVDSVVFRDTFVSQSIDTIEIENEKVKTIVYRHHDTFRIETKIKGDTIRVTKTIQLPPIVKYEKQSIWPFLLAAVGIFLGVIAMIKQASK